MAKFNDTRADRRNKLNIAALIERLEKVKQLRPEADGGGIAYAGAFEFEDLVSVLETAISFSRSFPATVRRRFMVDALFSPAAVKKLTRDALLREINSREAEYISRPPQKYIVLTSLSVPANLRIPPVDFGGGTVTFSSRLPRKFDRQPLAKAFKDNLHNPDPSQYTIVRISVLARSPVEAYEAGMDELDYVRGVWNFSTNRGIREVFSSGLRRPIGPFCLGQVHTVHESNGNLAVEAYWYNLFFVHHIPFLSGRNWGAVKANQRKIRQLVRTSRYSGDLRGAFIRYARALDGIDYEASFLKLWSLLEFLTNCSDGKYDSLVRRCAFLFRDYEYHQQILEHLRQRRNLFCSYGD
jgi:hypothetical protein